MLADGRGASATAPRRRGARRGRPGRAGRATRCAAAARRRAGAASTAASTSCLRTRPSRPVPCDAREVDAVLGGDALHHRRVAARAARARRRRVGLARVRLAGPRVGRRSARAPCRRRPSRPRSTRISARRPAGGRRAPRCRSCRSRPRRASRRAAPSRRPAWPSATTVPSATETPIAGIATSTSVSVGEELTARLPHAVDAGSTACSSGGRNGIGTSGVADAHDRAVEVLEALLGDQRGDLRARRAGARWPRRPRPPSSSVAHGREDRLLVQRHERAQVEHLAPTRRRGPRSASSAAWTIAP